MTYPLSDLTLARRLERCEAKANAATIEARARLQPEAGVAWIARGGAYALFDGIGSPLTQTFGLGVFTLPVSEDLDVIERFFTDRGAHVFHEVCPLAGIETMNVLSNRGYRPVELTSILYRPIAASDAAPDDAIRTRIIEPGEEELWANVAAEGWSEYPELSAFVQEIGRVTASSLGTSAFLAEMDGRPIAAGALSIHDRVALLAGASTVPAARNRGAQRALLEARLRYAAARGCDLAMMGAQPGSASQRNAERQAFRIAYTRIKFGRLV
jgi:GNAT superfamily N-acetyltransferase